ncbi:MAG: ribosomal-processing cysteine protease Prp [Clostridia bacterium]|nr:ribosomal-processing cysteine protease Prp [Clostridia bacterium]
MISVTITRERGRIDRVSVSGHAGYAGYGKDVVCAAVSAVAQTALMGLMHYESSVEYVRDDEKGYLSFSVPKGKNEAVLQGIVETAVIGLKDIATGYGTFVKVEEK